MRLPSLARSVVITCTFAACTWLWPVVVAAHSVPEQSVFDATGEIKNPFTVPDGVLAVMKTDPFVQENLRDQGIPSDQIPKSWFAASIVHLARSRESDVVLIGKGPLVGANVTQFWILRPTGHGYELLLQATGLVLSIKEGRLNGYRDISVGAATAVQVTTVLFRFDGHRYRAHRQSTIPIV